ncbi:hypothetical protein CHLNCDRAFT_139737 [Chlorella variabilis]|uniref:Uncharacterized protein n=1 Tax=Chlorella variabilis TaxID=554065 RepID=E1ZQU6_CHLVA|nr:hypothetical protein CHLNCDRAFT_139737 [Chlorella variabilis]EFN51785.1 hypothetical protein CHLNCDRAFT_139737 [Chlorella variabilis]|eukprot:XP_005843887.1 hypothetical protein CHLNCDRAFT_139737 [Chlorella variabilis]
MAVHVLAAPGCLSEGEALRFVEEKDVVKGDFVLVSGSVVGNVDLRPAVQAHVVRRGIDRQAVMTLLLHQGCLASDTSAPYLDDCLVVADPCSHQLLKLEHGNRAVHTANMGTHVFGERDVVVVRSGLRLSHVYICAPEALVLLSDNFDYQSIAGDLVPGVLSEQELGSTLYVHELARGYAERVGNRPGYVGIVEDVVGRWTYPWVPDNSGNQQDLCRFNRGFYM